MEHKYPKSFNDLIKPIKKEISITVLLSFLGTISLLIAPVAVVVSINKYLNDDLDSFLIWIIVAGVGLALRQILHMSSIGYAHFVEARFRYSLRKDFSDKLSRLPLGFFSENSSGAIRKMISEDTIKVHTIVAHGFSEFTACVTLPVACIVIMLIFEWHTALITIGLVLLLLVIAIFWVSMGIKNYQELNDKFENAQREMSHSAIEMVDGIKEIKNFGISGSLFKRFDDALTRFSKTSFEWLNTSSKAMSFLMSAVQPTVMLFISIGTGYFTIKKGWLEPEYLILFMLLSITLTASLVTLMQLGNMIKDGKHSINNLIQLYNIEDQKYIDNPKDFVLGDIEFKNVSFGYEEDNFILRDINCKIEKNNVTALVGASGSGKTSMARLISRFWDVNEGSVTIGGVDIRDLSEKDMLSNISLVFQDISIMNASIRENLSIAKEDATEEEIINAAKNAMIHDRIMRLPDGYDSIYGDDNVVLSGGERQRITIARAFLADTPIVILDEATAQADAESEAEIQRALSKLSKEKTVVIIAHRLSSIVDADKIIVMDDGKIIQEGIHSDLSNTAGMYQDMWTAQNDKKGVK